MRRHHPEHAGEQRRHQPGHRRRDHRPTCSSAGDIDDTSAATTRYTASSNSTAIRSSTRSITIVANVGGQAQPLLPGQQVRPQHVAGARRQQPKRGKSDDRRAEHGPEARRPDRRQQISPPDGARPIRGRDDAERDAQQIHPRPLDLVPHIGQVGVAQKPHEQTRRRAARRARFGASRTGHRRSRSEPPQYIRALRARGPVPLRTVAASPRLPLRCPPFRPRPVPSAAPLLDTRLNGTRPDRHGKVRDLFDLGDRLLLVATDRISAFDYVLGSGIPDKGKVLTQLSAFWFGHTAAIVPNHLLSTDMARPASRASSRIAELLAGPVDAGAQDAAAGHRVRGARVSLGIGLEGIPGDRRGVRRGAARRPARIRPPAAARSSRRPPRPSTGHDINISRSRGRRPHRRGARRAGCAT